jgi:hypothetical protein
MANIHKDSKGYWRFSKGAVIKDGKRQQKHHSLGADQRFAQILASFLEAEWEAIDGAESAKVWTDEALARAKQNANQRCSPATLTQATTPAPAPEAKPYFQPQPAPVQESQITLFQAFDLFKIDLEARVHARDVNDDHALRTMERINSAKRNFQDRPLWQVDQSFLLTIRRSVTARPLRRLCERVQKYDKDKRPIPLPARTPQPIAVETAFNWLMALSLAFDFFTRHNAPTAENPRQKLWNPDDIHWRDAFKITKKDKWKMMTDEERAASANPKQTYTVEHLKEIWVRAVPLDRMYMLFGVCLGWTQKEVATLRKDQIFNVNGEMYIRKGRGKTGVPGHWWVCPELADLITMRAAQTPDCHPKKLAFLTEDGNPLKHGRTDNIQTRWAILIGKLPKTMPQYPFSHLRKLAGQLIYNKSKILDFVRLLLAQTRTSVSEVHYIAAGVQVGTDESMFQTMHKYQRDIYEDLKPVFAAKRKPPTDGNQQPIAA